MYALTNEQIAQVDGADSWSELNFPQWAAGIAAIGLGIALVSATGIGVVGVGLVFSSAATGGEILTALSGIGLSAVGGYLGGHSFTHMG